MTKSLALIVVAAGCTSLGPMPATTSIAAQPLGRPAAEAQAGGAPGFYASQSARNDAKGTPIENISALIEPDRWLRVPGLVLGARIFGKTGDTPGEPLVGYRRKLGDRLGMAVVGFGSTKRSTNKLASYHGVRLGGEAAIDAELWTRSWLSVHAQGAASVTRILASGRYCVDAMGVAIDCNETDPDMNTMINGKTVGVFPAATATLALEIGKREGVFDHVRIGLLGTYGRMPLVLAGEEAGTGSYFSLGFSISLGVALGEGPGTGP